MAWHGMDEEQVMRADCWLAAGNGILVFKTPGLDAVEPETKRRRHSRSGRKAQNKRMKQKEEED